MATCSRCGETVDFRYLDGRCVPLHSSGGCSGGPSSVSVYAGLSVSEESECFKTKCPECQQPVFFIRHNGGSVWIEPPLGAPWFKHPCMDREAAQGIIKRSLVSPETLSRHQNRGGLVIGIVKASETSADRLCTVLYVLTGEDEALQLLMKHNAGFLAGRVIVIDPVASTAQWVEDAFYTFKIVAPLGRHERYNFARDRVPCPSCQSTVRLDRLPGHLARVHRLRSLSDADYE